MFELCFRKPFDEKQHAIRSYYIVHGDDRGSSSFKLMIKPRYVMTTRMQPYGLENYTLVVDVDNDMMTTYSQIHLLLLLLD